jgi:hypothetical protein
MVRNIVAETIRRKSKVLTQKSKARKQVKGKSFNSKFTRKIGNRSWERGGSQKF